MKKNVLITLFGNRKRSEGRVRKREGRWEGGRERKRKREGREEGERKRDITVIHRSCRRG